MLHAMCGFIWWVLSIIPTTLWVIILVAGAVLFKLAGESLGTYFKVVATLVLGGVAIFYLSALIPIWVEVLIIILAILFVIWLRG